MGRIKGKMGLKGKIKPGELISRMNKMKYDKMSEINGSGFKKNKVSKLSVI